MTERRRLIELALLGLQQEQVRIQQEITALRSELGHANPRAVATAGTSTGRTSPNKGKTMSMAQRRKISLAMKKRWAATRKKAA